MDSSSPAEPPSAELAELYAHCEGCEATTPEIVTGFSDDLAALVDLQEELRAERSKDSAAAVVRHRLWTTGEVFRSAAAEPTSSSPVDMPTASMASSPPPTPAPPPKRRLADLDLGENQLGRPAKIPKAATDGDEHPCARPVRAQRTHYGIDILRLLDDARAEESMPRPAAAARPLPPPAAEHAAAASTRRSSLLWTEKYRARKFTDLIGDERTHRSVMQWLKRWDPIVFPGSSRPKQKAKGSAHSGPLDQEKPFRKILLLTGPPGLGKTTLAHVCAKQAGYEVQEINASDERSAGVVKGRIRDMVGTENVKGVGDSTTGAGRMKKGAKPACVVVDEVDGVVAGGGGGGGGEGGFIKALIDLILLDHRNSSGLTALQQAPAGSRKKKGDRFRLLRPMILICNDVYHPSLRPLRQSSHAEVIHVRKPQLQTIAARMQSIFNREGIPTDADGVRRLCEATWGVSGRNEDRAGRGAGEGDMRGIMVVGEWVAGKLRAMADATGADARLTRRWVEENIVHDLAHGGGAARGLGRGGPKEIVERVFKEGAGFPKSSATMTPQHQTGHNNGAKGVAEGLKRTATERLRELVDTHGDADRIVTDVFSLYPEQSFQDDTLLSKPDAAYEWLHFHDRLASAVYTSNDWELAPYLSTPVLAFHHLFASPTRAQYASANASAGGRDAQDGTANDEGTGHPFSGPQASWAAHERIKQNETLLQSLQDGLSLELSRSFKSTADLSTGLVPYLLQMLNPTINPVVVGGSSKEGGTASVRKASEQALVQRSVNAMAAAGVRFDRIKVTADDAPTWQSAQWVYRMEPPLDVLGAFETGGKHFAESIAAAGGGGKQRYAVRQVLNQGFRKDELRRAEAARLARFQRFSAGATIEPGAEGSTPGQRKPAGAEPAKARFGADKRDFFGRPIATPAPETVRQHAANGTQTNNDGKGHKRAGGGGGASGRVWVTYHEGFSNAVRKPITLAELLKGL